MLEHRAFLADTPSSVFEALEEAAEQNGFPVERTGAKVEIKAPLGHLTFVHGENGTDITFGAESPAQLQLFKDLYGQRFAKLGVTDALKWAPVEGAWPLNQMMGTVVSTERISKNFIRLRLAGDFSPFHREGAGMHFRLLFSSTGAGWPTLDERGLTQWPDGAASWHRPSFTVRGIGADAEWIDIDVVLHEGGRATEWVKAVQPGEEIAIHGPSGTTQPTEAWIGLIGDDTALSIMMRIVEGAPAGTKGKAIILVRDPSDAQPAVTASDIEVIWAVMGQDDPVALIEELQPEGDDFHIFFAAERSQATAARTAYKARGFSGRQAKAASYWTVAE